MAMTGTLKTFTKNDIRSKEERNEKKQIDSYNPAMSSRELNPYWKSGGSGLPQTPESFRKSKSFIRPEENDNYYSKSTTKPSKLMKEEYSSKVRHSEKECLYNKKTYNWKHTETDTDTGKNVEKPAEDYETKPNNEDNEKPKMGKYLSDDKMNKLAAKIVKADIMGNLTLAAELKEKLEAARQFRNQNPDILTEDDDQSVMLISGNNLGNIRPLIKNNQVCSSSIKRKADTHNSGERIKYFGDDDKYNLAQMVRYLLVI